MGIVIMKAFSRQESYFSSNLMFWEQEKISRGRARKKLRKFFQEFSSETIIIFQKEDDNQKIVFIFQIVQSL